MAISEVQLTTWSHQGSVAQSSDTYQAIKRVLEGSDTPYRDKSFKVFLQGSYGNDTNIYAESDVDVVIQLDDCFRHDLSTLPEPQKQLFQASFADAAYRHGDFKTDVKAVLEAAYGKDVKAGDKAIMIAGNAGRRKADVIVAIQYRRYFKFNGIIDQSYDEGICFYDAAGKEIANYPKQHSENLTKKHKETSQWLKPMVRILKNMRSRMVDDKLIANGLAPSYYVEGLLYNVPKEMYGSSYVDTFVNCINWIRKADRSKFVCANEQYYLLREDSPVTWRAGKCDEFLNALVEQWNSWTQ